MFGRGKVFFFFLAQRNEFGLTLLKMFIRLRHARVQVHLSSVGFGDELVDFRVLLFAMAGGVFWFAFLVDLRSVWDPI